MSERLRRWKWVLMLGAAYVLIPAIIAPLFAQRQGDELGRVATCLCCLDIRIPDVGPVGGIIAVVILVVVIAIGVYSEGAQKRLEEEQKRKAAEEKAREEALKEERKRQATEQFGWFVGQTVWFQNDGQEEYGVVMEQDMDTLYINRLTPSGGVERISRKVGELTWKQSSPPQN